MNPFRENIHNIVTLYNYDPLCRETSRFVIPEGEVVFPRACLSENNAPRVDKSGCFPTQRAVIVLLYFCQCFIGYLCCGGKLGFSAGNNRVASRQHKFCKCLIGYLPCGEKLGCSAGNNGFIYVYLKKKLI